MLNPADMLPGEVSIPDDFASRDLPKHRTDLHPQWLARLSWWRIAGYGLTVYVAIVLLAVGIETISLWYGRPLVVGSKGNSAGVWDLLYFNFIHDPNDRVRRVHSNPHWTLQFSH